MVWIKMEDGGIRCTKKIVEAIQDGIFVEFAWFPALEEGPSEGDWKESPGECSESPGQSSGRKRKEWKEVPDLSKWSTCFSLFQAAWAKHKPEMWLPFTAYREIIFKLVRCHPWAQVFNMTGASVRRRLEGMMPNGMKREFRSWWTCSVAHLNQKETEK